MSEDGHEASEIYGSIGILRENDAGAKVGELARKHGISEGTIYAWEPAPGRFEQVGQLVKLAERYAGKTIPCTLQMTDGPYGNVTWRRGGASKVLSVQFGCTSRHADKVYDQLDEARLLAEAWAVGAPVTEEASPPR